MILKCTIFTLFTTLFFVGLSMFYAIDPMITGENSLYENLQVLLLVVALLVSLAAFFRGERRYEDRYLLTGLTFLIISFLLREGEFNEGEASTWLVWIVSSDIARIFTLILFVPFIAYSLWQIRTIWPIMMRFLRTRVALGFVLAGFGLIAGGVFDREWIETAHNQFFEELLELGGYYVFIFATLAMWRQPLRQLSCWR